MSESEAPMKSRHALRACAYWLSYLPVDWLEA